MCLLVLSVVIFYVAGYQPNNVVQNFTLNGVTKTYVTRTMDLPGSTYFDFINWIFVFTFLSYCLTMIREFEITGTYRQNNRTPNRH